MSLSKTLAIDLLRGICKQMQVKIIFRRFKDDYYGKCDQDGRTVHINTEANAKDIAITVFHELAHVHCIRNGMWKEFHDGSFFSAKKIFFIENKVEWIAKKMWDDHNMRKYFGQFQFYYSKRNKKEAMQWIKDNYESD
jgi:hypothetical protein